MSIEANPFASFLGWAKWCWISPKAGVEAWMLGHTQRLKNIPRVSNPSRREPSAFAPPPSPLFDGPRPTFTSPTSLLSKYPIGVVERCPKRFVTRLEPPPVSDAAVDATPVVISPSDRSDSTFKSPTTGVCGVKVELKGGFGASMGEGFARGWYHGWQIRTMGAELVLARGAPYLALLEPWVHHARFNLRPWVLSFGARGATTRLGLGFVMVLGLYNGSRCNGLDMSFKV
ncbi:hypothetical protein GQ457_17G008290 [Hibiscus cannabinus]